MIVASIKQEEGVFKVHATDGKKKVCIAWKLDYKEALELCEELKKMGKIEKIEDLVRCHDD